ncbi:helix-turn-helix domain-containing protein [Algoriphagus aquatilis]|uniref:Helix-turn-helix domain-containing protein n=1 Tax=Algoriphagus aquatilis TaxID=490186 RepID=A0ABW0C0C1_9BACT
MKEVFESIKKFRELKSITRETMAAELGMSLSGYSKLERGEVDITLSKVQSIARILNVSLEQLLNFDASQIFNVSNNQQVQGLGSTADVINFYGDDYKEKYIKMLEREIERLRKIVGE